MADILVVDDRPENLAAFTEILSGTGAGVSTANSGEEGFAKALEREFALILLDVQMPGIDGFQTAEMLRANESTRDVPIIFITALMRADSYIFRGYQHSAVDYILKPVSGDILRAKVDVFLRLNKQKKDLALALADLQSLTSAAHHDLQAPARGVAMQTELLKMDHWDELSDGVRDYVSNIESSANRMLMLTKRLVAFARLQHHRVERSRFGSREAVNAVLATLAPRISKLGAVVVCDDDLPEIEADQVQFERILQNLVDNALKYGSGDVPHIDISGMLDGGGGDHGDDGVAFWRFEVADNGCGVEQEFREAVFDPFRRLHREHRDISAGLGLSSVKRMVAEHGGEVWIGDNPAGQGSVFGFSLRVREQ